MGTKYILITSQNPLKTELSDFLLKPELDKSDFAIKLISSTKPEKEGDALILNDQYTIEILDKSASITGIKFNHLCITKIEYDYKITLTPGRYRKSLARKIVELIK